MLRALRFVSCCVVLAAAPACAASLLYSIGPDSTGSTPSGFYSVTTGGTATWLFDLGDGTLGFNGGLAYRAGTNVFYAIANDSAGNSSLVSFSASGASTITTIASLGQGFLGGLAYNSANDSLYAISNDISGNSTLHQVGLTGTASAVGSLGSGFYGGLTFNPANGLLYGFSADAWGTQREFQEINPATAAAAWQFELGDGSVSFNGGLAYSPGTDLFYVISNDAWGSTLQTLALSGTLAAVSGIGGGFWNVALAGPLDAGAPVPEPAMWLPLAGCLIAGRLIRLRPRP
jgi:hypothetical protein